MGGRAAFKELIFLLLCKANHSVLNDSQKTGSSLGRLLFLFHLCFFSCILFGGIGNFCIFAIKLREICYVRVTVDFLI